MRTVSLSRDAVHTGNLILVNREYPLCEGLCEKRLVPVGKKSNEVLLEARTATVLQKLLDDINCGEQIVAVSGFRSKYEQTRIYETSLHDNGTEFTTKYVALPNHSEHQSGLAIDLALDLPNIDTLCPYFPYTGVCGTFRDKAVPFGFIERYPKGKEDITGIAHEPWHFRYVGYPHSEFISKNRLTLEEYTHFIKQFTGRENPLKIQNVIKNIEIFYLPAYSDETTLIIPEQSVCQVSGNNIDGYIVTLWRNSYE